jgi:hypothetical protein
VYDAVVKARVVWLLILLLTLAGVAYAYYPPFRLFTFVVAGRSPVCPLAEAVRADENLQRQVEYKDQILNASKLVEQDPKGYELWDTPKGRYWIPAELWRQCWRYRPRGTGGRRQDSGRYRAGARESGMPTSQLYQ